MAVTQAQEQWVSMDSALYAEVTQFMFLEAELLDALREREWLENMVSRDIDYRLPLRQTVERARGTGFAESTYHMLENYGSLTARVLRNETAFAWAEDPASRVRHFVTNVRAIEVPGEPDCIDVRSNLLIFRTRQDQTLPQMLAGERQDRLRREDGSLRLLSRLILLDHTVIGTHNLSIFF